MAENVLFKPTPYQSHQLATRGVLAAPGGWRLKLYDIAYDALPLDEARFAAGVDGALTGLPQPALTAQHPGAGALIRHAGAAWTIWLEPLPLGGCAFAA